MQQLVSEASANDDTPTYADGTFAVDLQLDPANIDPATKATLALLEQMKTTPISAERLQRAKTQMKVARVNQLQTAENLAASLCDDFYNTGDAHFSDKYVDRVEAVTAAQLQDVAKRYLNPQKLITTLMLPSDAPGAAGLARATDMIRPATTQAASASATTAPSADTAVQRIPLDNGMVLLLKRITTSPLVTMNCYSLGGVTAEDATNNGIGNLAMQMLPRGTATRTAEQIATFFDSVGGSLDTACGNNTWYWTASCLKDDFAKTLDVYADVIQHPKFDDAELAEMKQRTDAGISEQDADWTAQATRFFKQAFFGPQNSPYRFIPIGTKENVDKLTAEQLRDWYQQKVLGAKKVIAIYGDIDPENAKQLVTKLFATSDSRVIGNEVTAFVHRPIPPAATPAINVADVKVQQTQQALAGVVIGFKSNSSQGDPQNYTLDVGQTMAGGWGYPTGYLFETLRGKGLVYVVEAQNVPGREAKLPGYFLVLAGCGPDKVDEVVDQILLNIARLQGTDADMQADWFTRSKLLITTGDAIDNETPAAQASTAALDELFGLGCDYHAQFANQINAVTLDQIRGVARARLRDCVVTVSTPDPASVKIATGVRTYPSFPTVDLTPRGVQHDQSVQRP